MAGGAIGVFLGTLTGSDIYRLEQKNAGEKKSLLQMILHREGDVPGHPPVVQQQRDVIYLKDSRVIRGTVVELIPDSTVRILTADSSVFVFRMSEVERMAKEIPARVAVCRDVGSYCRNCQDGVHAGCRAGLHARGFRQLGDKRGLCISRD